MVPPVNCHIYGIWRSKEVGNVLKSSLDKASVTRQATKGGNSFYCEEGVSLCSTSILKLCYKSYWVL